MLDSSYFIYECNISCASFNQNEGDTALHIATLQNHPSVVEVLAKLTADSDTSNKV